MAVRNGYRLCGCLDRSGAPRHRVQTIVGQEFSCDFWSDVIHPTGAEILAVYQNDYFAQGPALTVHHYGKGVCYYLGTRLAPEGLAWVLDRVCDDADVHPVLEAPGGVEVTLRSDGVRQWLFLLNYSENDIQIDVPSGAINVIIGNPIEGKLHIGPKDVVILQNRAPSGIM